MDTYRIYANHWEPCSQVYVKHWGKFSIMNHEVSLELKKKFPFSNKFKQKSVIKGN